MAEGGKIMRILKKTVLLLMAIIFAASLATGPAAEARSWYWLVSNDYDSIYFDTETAYRESDRAVRCWVKMDHSTGTFDVADIRYRNTNHRIYMYIGDVYHYSADKRLEGHQFGNWRSMLLAPGMIGYTAAIKII